MSKLSDAFREMADRIDHNEASPFGGAIVIVTPAPEGGEPEIFETILLGRTTDPVIFWESLKKITGNSLNKLNEMERRSEAGWTTR